jgi:hypothetical protein
VTDRTFDGRRRILAGLVVSVTVGLAVGATLLAEASVQQPVPADGPANAFSAERALQHLRAFADEPRPTGSAGNDRAREYLVGQLRAGGLAVEVQHAIGRWDSSGLATFGEIDNIVATLPGTDPTGSVLLVAHYDSAAVGPGASDDGAAVAAILETVRVLRAGGPLRNDLVLLLTDGEEEGLLGAEAFAREHPLARRGGVVVNFEARGVTGPSLMFETSRDNAGLVALFRDAVPHPRGDSSMVEVYRLLPNNSDFSALSAAGFVGYNFAYIEGASHYHTAGDSLANLDRGSVQHHGENMVGLARALGRTDLRTLSSDHDTTYFRVLGTTVGYPAGAGRFLAGAAVVLLVGVAVLARRRRLARGRAVAIATVSAAVPLIGSAALGQALWSVLVWIRPDYDAMGGLVHRPLPFQAALVGLAAAAVAGWYLVLRERFGATTLWIGALVWPAGLGVLCAVHAPGAGYLFTLPALAGGTAVAVGVLVERPLWSVAATGTAAVVSALILPNFVRLLFVGAGLAVAGAGCLVAAVFVLTVLPVLDLLAPWTWRVRVGVPAGALVMSVVLVAAGLAADRADARHPGRTHLTYVLNADTGRAFWASAESAPTAWTRGYVTGRETAGLPPGYRRRPLWTGAAPRIDASGPRVTVRSRIGDTVTVHVASARSARALTLRIDRTVTAVTATVRDRAPVAVDVAGTRADTWPAEIRFRGLPADGAEFSFRTAPGRSVRVTAIDETLGLGAVPGFRARPPTLVAGTREDGDRVAVTHTVTIP